MTEGLRDDQRFQIVQVLALGSYEQPEIRTHLFSIYFLFFETTRWLGKFFRVFGPIKITGDPTYAVKNIGMIDCVPWAKDARISAGLLILARIRFFDAFGDDRLDRVPVKRCSFQPLRIFDVDTGIVQGAAE